MAIFYMELEIKILRALKDALFIMQISRKLLLRAFIMNVDIDK